MLRKKRFRLEKENLMNFWEVRAELKRLDPTDLLKMALNQGEHHCVLNPKGPCPYYFKYKGFGFCVSELSGQGCQAEKARQGGETFVIHTEAKNGNEKVLGIAGPDPFHNRISRSQFLKEVNQ